MSEGFKDKGAPERFWVKRMHYVLDALVEAGIPEIERSDYLKAKAEMLQRGLDEPQAAWLAFLTMSSSTPSSPSACEVNPW